MEKIYIKPTSHEIIIKGALADGHTDIFSYDPSDEQTKKLGHLFIVGHVQHETDDMTYSVNLISALAKREYYSKLTAAPKEAFASTLKKVNEVVEEFFEHKGLQINIGIFAIAGEQLHISKLGKFKILLAREDKTIDVLNNILFDKEQVQEKQFSSVISGQVNEKDRILAFYPSRATTARERYLKMYLHKYDAAQFAQQLQDIKKDKDAFNCAMVYIQLDKIKEITAEPRIQPQELSSSPQLATAPLSASKPAIRKTRVEPKKTTSPTPSSTLEEAPLAETVSPVRPLSPITQEKEPVVKNIVTTSNRYIETNMEVPRIIPSEFSLGKKDNFITTAVHRFGFSHLTPKKKAFLSLLSVAIIISASFGVQAVISGNPEARALNDSLKGAREQLDLARIKLSQDDKTGARLILNTSMASLAAISSDKTKPIEEELRQFLDEIDQAQDASPTVVTQLPQDQGQATLISTGKNIFAYLKGTEEGKGNLITLENGSIRSSNEVANTQPSMVVTSTKGTPVAIDLANKKTVAIKDSGPEIATFSIGQPVASYFYEDNLYIIQDGIIQKIADIFQGNAGPKSWMKTDTPLVVDPALMVVDGNIFVMTKQGVLATYFRGEKVSEVATSLNVSSEHLLLTHNDAASLYLVDKQSGRIYILDKKTGTLLKTLKIGSQEAIVTAAIATDNTIYFLTRDNKIWKITQ